jgi:MerR family mercuric resistance operon transcriptional regulator
MLQSMTISRLAAAARVGVETVRFYQRRGLIEEPSRPAAGYRRYSEADVHRIRFIRRAKELGFTLGEITSLLRLEGVRTCTRTRALAARKLHMVEGKLADLAALRDVLASMIRRCDAGRERGACPIIQSLTED